MSNVNKEDKKPKLESKEKEKTDIENVEEHFQNEIDLPKSSYSNPNDISKINSSFCSSIDSDKDKNKNMNNKSNDKIEKNKINSVIGIDSIINEENYEQKRGSKFSSVKYILDEFAKAERFSVDNEK